ncbi:MAG: hypothetical protein K6A44_03935 [bacterium]|nr:hypothetical protein [bacterium]
MNISTVSSTNFNALLMPMAPVYNAPVPAIIRSVSAVKKQAAPIADAFIKSSNPSNLPTRRFFCIHEAIVTDPKIRVVGLGKESSRTYGVTKLKGAGRKHAPKIWQRR